MEKSRPIIIIAFVLVVAIIGALLLVRRNRNLTDDSIPLPSPSATNNNSDDVVIKLEEFGDYQCPPCAQLHPDLKSLKQEFGPRLNFIFRNLPLENIHKNALVAAQAAEAARMQNRFWEMHGFLYENQEGWKDQENPRPFFIKVAGEMGLNRDQFVRDMDGEQVKARIQADKDAAVSLGITGTPTVLIEGRQLRPEATNATGIRRGIELMITRRGAGSP